MAVTVTFQSYRLFLVVGISLIFSMEAIAGSSDAKGLSLFAYPLTESTDYIEVPPNIAHKMRLRVLFDYDKPEPNGANIFDETYTSAYVSQPGLSGMLREGPIRFLSGTDFVQIGNEVFLRVEAASKGSPENSFSLHYRLGTLRKDGSVAMAPGNQDGDRFGRSPCI